MEPKRADRAHEELRELLGAYALDAVTSDERARLEAHLATCAACRGEVAELRLGVFALPLALPELEPPPALRERILAAVTADLRGARPAPDGPWRREATSAAGGWPAAAGPATPTVAPSQPRPLATPTPLRPPTRLPLGVWAAAALLLIALAGLLTWNLRLQSEVTRLGGTETVALVPGDAAPDASGQVTYLPARQVMILSVRDLPPLAEGEVYEAWLIGGDGVPVPAGVFTGDVARHAITADPAAYDAVAITAEAGPLGTASPTGTILATVPLGSI